MKNAQETEISRTIFQQNKEMRESEKASCEQIDGPSGSGMASKSGNWRRSAFWGKWKKESSRKNLTDAKQILIDHVGVSLIACVRLRLDPPAPGPATQWQPLWARPGPEPGPGRGQPEARGRTSNSSCQSVI